MSGCPHPGAPGSCPLCRIGEGFTPDGESALSLLDAMLEAAQAGGRDLEKAPLAWARDCVLEREWIRARHRLHQRRIDDGDICATTGLLGSICRCIPCRERRGVPRDVTS